MSSVSCLLFNPVGRLVSHHSVLFCLLVHHLNLPIIPFLSLSLSLSLGIHRIQENFKKKRGRKQTYINPQKGNSRREQQMKQIRVTFRAKLVVGYWELVPMESVADNSSEKDTATVTNELEEPTSK